DAKKPTREQFDIEIAAMGMGVVEVERTPQGLKPVIGRYNRRITVDTPFTLTGPAAGTHFVKTVAHPPGPAPPGSTGHRPTGRPDWPRRLGDHGQLLRWRNPVGNGAFRRGELPHLLRRRGGRTETRPGRRRPL